MRFGVEFNSRAVGRTLMLPRSNGSMSRSRVHRISANLDGHAFSVSNWTKFRNDNSGMIISRQCSGYSHPPSNFCSDDKVFLEFHDKFKEAFFPSANLFLAILYRLTHNNCQPQVGCIFMANNIRFFGERSIFRSFKTNSKVTRSID